MRKLLGATVAVIAAVLPLTSVATAAPSFAAGGMTVPLGANWRACDGSLLRWVSVRQYGQAVAEITPGSNTVSANVGIVMALPDTQYNVRLIQIPRPTQNCAAGDPGVIAGSFRTDAIGTGGVSISGPIKSGATGAWVLLDLPSSNSQTPQEFYTSAFTAAI